jgi:hypothetical protein
MDGATHARVHLCARCVRLADEAERAGYPVPHVHDARAWTSLGVRYVGGLCAGCAQFERGMRANLRARQQQLGGRER